MENPTTPTAEPSISDFRAMLTGATETRQASTETKAASTEAITATSDTATAEENHEAVTEPAETKPEPKESEDEPLPEGVQKRIAKEAERAARIQSEIDRAVSARKAKESELAKVTSGSEPAPTTETAAKPLVAPEFGETGHESETWPQYKAREQAHLKALIDQSKAEALKEFEDRAAQTQAKAKATEWMQKGVATHGKDFPAKVAAVEAVVPAQWHGVIGGLEGAHAVAVHLADHPAKLKELAEAFEANPVQAIIKLGRIEASLTSTPKPATTLPEPLAKVGGNASAGGMSLQDTAEKGTMTQLRALVKQARSR